MLGPAMALATDATDAGEVQYSMVPSGKNLRTYSWSHTGIRGVR